VFTRKEGSDDTRDVVAQRSVNLPYMTQSREVAGGVLTTDKASNGVGGSWTRVKLAPTETPDLPETRYIYSTVISADQINNPYRLQWLAGKEDFDIELLDDRRMEIVRLLPFGSAKRPQQRTLAFTEIGSGQGNHYNLAFGVTNSIKAAIGEVVYQRQGVVEPLRAQYTNIAPRGEALGVYTLSIVFQPTTTGYREPYAIDGSATSVTLGYEKGAYSYFGVPYLHYEAQGTGQLVHPGLQQIRYLRARVASESASQAQVIDDILIFQAPRGVYYGDPIVTRVSKTKLFAVCVNVSTQTIDVVLGSEVITDSVVGEPVAFMSTDDGATWNPTTAPSWDMSNYEPSSTFIDYRYNGIPNKVKSPLQIQYLTKLIPWKNSAVGVSLFYNNGNSAGGGEYLLFLMTGTGPVFHSIIPMDAYRYVLIGACRPIGAAVFTFRTRASPKHPFYDDGIYPSATDAFFNELTVDGYATHSVIAVYDGVAVVTRGLPWPRLYANSEVFCLGGKEIGTVVYNITPSAGGAAYWVFSSKDYGVTWNEKFAVDALSDPPKFAIDGQTQKEVVYDNGTDYSLPPQIIFPELVEGEKVPPCPGVNF
jgi:hypothetical protein